MPQSLDMSRLRLSHSKGITKGIQSLPNELLLEIFEFLGYNDLRIRVPAVCKHFRTLLKDGEIKGGYIDKILFRDEAALARPAPVGRSKATKDYKIHPAFALLRFTPKRPDASVTDPMKRLASVYFRTWKRDRNMKKDISIIRTSIPNENAISPAVSKVIVHLPSYMTQKYDGSGPIKAEFQAKMGQSVTVTDVLVTYLRLFDQFEFARAVDAMVKGYIMSQPILQLKEGVVHITMT